MVLNDEIESSKKNISLGVDGTNSRPRATEANVPAISRGSSAVFEEMWRTHAGQILHIAHRITNNREDAEDALQDSFLRAYIHLHSFDGRSSLATWLTRIAINSALLLLRKRASTPQLSLDDDGDSPTGRGFAIAVEQGPSPENLYSQAEQRAVVRKGIRTLRPAARWALELRVLEDHSVKETAEKMGLSVPATKSRIFQAKAALRKSLKPKVGGRTRRTEQLQFLVA
jgi:RNA polymerase sigma factor (sigma-70 family)